MRFQISKWKLSLVTFLMIIIEYLVIYALAITYEEVVERLDKHHPIMFYFVFGLMALVLSFTIVGCVITIFRQNAGLTLDRDGIIDHTSLFSIGHIPADMIAGVTNNEVSKNQTLILQIKDLCWLKNRGIKGYILSKVVKHNYSIPTKPLLAAHNDVAFAVKAHITKLKKQGRLK